MKTSTVLVLGAVAVGAAWWWWTQSKAAAAVLPTVRPAAGSMLPAIDWSFFNSLPIPGLSSIDQNGMILRPMIYVD